MKTDSPLKKHHFWLLCGVVPLFTLIGVSCVSSNVGGKIAEREKAIEDADKAIGSKKDPKPDSLLKKAEQSFGRVSSKQEELHKINWNRQKHLYTWPEGSRLLKRFEQMNLKFGEPLPTNEGEFEEFRKPEVYIYEFSSIRNKDGGGAPGRGMADRIAPTQFAGGSWRSVLRHVNDFGQAQITKDQVWLIMEDIWVQRSLLDAVRTINAEMAAFRRGRVDKDGNVTIDPSFDEAGNKLAVDPAGRPVEKNRQYVRVPTPDDQKRKAVFLSRTWSIELELVREGASQRLVGTLTNQSERLQLMGVNNVMTLHVWFSKDPSAQPLVFKIGGEFLPGKGSIKRDPSGRDVPANVLPIVPIDDHVLPVAMGADEIVRVEQVLDIRTVPVKRIEKLALSYPDSRNAGKPLLPPTSPPFSESFVKDPLAVDPNAPPGEAGAMPGAGPGAAPPMPGPVAMPGAGPDGFGKGFGPGNTLKGLPWGGGPLAAVIDGNKKRYLADGVTPQVRRMPVGIVVVVDQSYMQDMLLAFANSPLRFQITQVNWTRFRGTLAGIGPSGGTTGPGGGIDYVPGTINFGGEGDPDFRRGAGGFGPPAGPVGPMGPFGPMGPGMPGSPSAMSGTSSTVSESQITSGLVELSVYGIVSLYEKYEAPKPPDAATANPQGPAPAPGPMPPAPGPAPAPAPGPMPTAPKMRRRARA